MSIDRKSIIEELEKIADRLEKAPAEIEEASKRDTTHDRYVYAYQVGVLQQTMTSVASQVRTLLKQMERKR